MKFRTEIEVSPFSFNINHKSKVLLMGSCFTTNVGEKLTYYGFETFSNPFGIAFNPDSLAKQISQIVKGYEYLESDLVEHQGQFLSFDHHSSFNRQDASSTLDVINSNLEQARAAFKNADVLFLSLGSAWVWERKESKTIVNNCHKIASNKFNQKLLSYDEILSSLNKIVDDLKEFAPQLKVVFTLSPIRHWRHGAVENMQSKSLLHAAIQSVVKENELTHYFPSYEIMMDDLRDYRFYADDMLHPSEQAIDYIWQKFGETFFIENTRQANDLIRKIRMMQDHRNVAGTNEELDKFNQKLKNRLDELNSDFGIELKIFK